jgi:hypothetical protein
VETFVTIAVFGLAIGAAVGLTRGAWRRRDAERRQAERAAYERRRQTERTERSEAAVADLVDRYFPFARAAWSASTGRGTARERLRRTLGEVEGIVVGVADIGFDAVLPGESRRKGLAAWGKTGAGKTVVALHLIDDDLRHGRGLCILGSEAELFRDWLLPLVPPARAADTLLFRPADPACTLTWNPVVLEDGEDQALAAGELFSIFKRALGETTIGARADAILSAAFGVLVGRRGATLWSVIRLLEDEAYRNAVIADVDDPYLRDFWTKSFPAYPAGAALPLVHRMHQVLRLPQLRAAICHPVSSISIRDALEKNRNLFFDLSGLDPDAIRLVGQMLLSKFQIELMRRERVREEQRAPVSVFVDEFHVFADAAEGTWRELLARGRRYGLGLHLFTQHPNQLPRSLQQEIFGNVSSLIVLALSAADAGGSIRRELLVPVEGGARKPVPAEEIVSLPVGEGFARLGTGACALRVRFRPPIERPDPAAGDRVREISWRTYAAPPLPKEDLVVPAAAAVTAVTSTSAARPATTIPGRGGPQHKMLQQLAKQWGEERGFRANLEQDVLGGAGRVDVVLTRDDVRIAIEVSVTSSGAEVAETVGKCVASGFDYVLVVGTSETDLQRAQEATAGVIPAKDRSRLQFVLPDRLRSFLEGLSPSTGTADLTAGYTVRVEVPADGQLRHRAAVARLVGTALLRRRPSS